MSWASLPSTEFQDAESAPGDSPIHPTAAAAAAGAASSSGAAAAVAGRAAGGMEPDMQLLDLSGDWGARVGVTDAGTRPSLLLPSMAVAAAAGLPVPRAAQATQEPHLNWLASLRTLGEWAVVGLAGVWQGAGARRLNARTG
jgi:hypothetical protein